MKRNGLFAARTLFAISRDTPCKSIPAHEKALAVHETQSVP